MLTNVGFFSIEFKLVGLGGCDMVSRTTSLFVFLPPVPAKCVALMSLGYSMEGDVAMLGARAVGFRLVVGFVTEPIPPGNPNFADVTATVLHMSDMGACFVEFQWG